MTERHGPGEGRREPAGQFSPSQEPGTERHGPRSFASSPTTKVFIMLRLSPLSLATLLLATMGLLWVGTTATAQDGSGPDGVTKAGAAEAEEREAGFVPLFDGRLLTGWEGNGAWFRVDQRAIVGGNLDKPIPHNYFLCTTRSFSDFELRLEVKMVGDGANGGIQFRSQRVANSEEVEGYQADAGGVGEQSVWGGLYDESRRRKFIAQPDAEFIHSLVKPDDWNEYRIRCVGPKIELYLNGMQTVDYTEPDDSIPQSGIIGLQIHSGPPAEAWYRNLRIKPL